MAKNVNEQDLNRPPLDFENTEKAFQEKSDRQLEELYKLFKLLNNRRLYKIAPVITRFFLSLKSEVINNHFYGGKSLDACKPIIKQIGLAKLNAILNYSADKSQKKTEYNWYCEEIIRAVNYASTNDDVPFVQFKVSALARLELLQKMATTCDLSSAEEAEYFKIKGRINSICKTALDSDVQVIIEAEDSNIQDSVDALAVEAMQFFNLEKAVVYNTYSFYQQDKTSLKNHYSQAEMYGFFLGANLVSDDISKYSDISLASQPDNYQNALEFCLAHLKYISLIVNTHDQESCLHFIKVLNTQSVPLNHPNVYLSQHLGLNDELSFNLAKAGFNVAKCIIYGDYEAHLPALLTIQKKNKSVEVPMERALKLIIAEKKRRISLH